MNFDELLHRLRTHLRARIRNGELTERGLARRVGLSQSHIHNVLKGERVLTAKTADRILQHLGKTVSDLMAEVSEGGEAALPKRAAGQPRLRGKSRELRGRFGPS